MPPGRYVLSLSKEARAHRTGACSLENGCIFTCSQPFLPAILFYAQRGVVVRQWGIFTQISILCRGGGAVCHAMSLVHLECCYWSLWMLLCAQQSIFTGISCLCTGAVCHESSQLYSDFYCCNKPTFWPKIMLYTSQWSFETQKAYIGRVSFTDCSLRYWSTQAGILHVVVSFSACTISCKEAGGWRGCCTRPLLPPGCAATGHTGADLYLYMWDQVKFANWFQCSLQSNSLL